MQYRTHFATSLAVSLPIMAHTGTLSVGNLVALGVGAVFPDIDEPHSWIGVRTRGLSHLIKLFFGHRGLVHSLFGLTLAILTVALLIALTPFNVITGVYFIIGYVLHLVEDSFSKSGVKWLLPLNNKSYQFGNELFYYVTGGLVENLIFLTTVVILVYQIKTLDFSAISFPEVNLTQAVSSLIQKTASYMQ